MAPHVAALEVALDEALPRWIARVAPEVDPAPVAGEVMRRVRALLALDVDLQTTTPLAIIREHAVPELTSALRAAGRQPVADRDPFLAERFPEDVYGLTPSAWVDIDPSLQEPGIAWGAAKAWTHRQRHRA